MKHISFIDTEAIKYGINESIIIQHFRFWITKNILENRNFYDNNFWTYNSIKATASFFGFLSYEQVKYAISKLKKKGVLVEGNYNKLNLDKTKWYAFNNLNEFILPYLNDIEKDLIKKLHSDKQDFIDKLKFHNRIGKIPQSNRENSLMDRENSLMDRENSTTNTRYNNTDIKTDVNTYNKKPPKINFWDELSKEVNKFLKEKKLFTFKEKFNLSKTKKEIKGFEGAALQISEVSKIAKEYAEYIDRNRRKSARFNKWLIAYIENNLADIEYSKPLDNKQQPKKSKPKFDENGRAIFRPADEN